MLSSSPSRRKGRREGRAPAGTRKDPRAEQMHTQCTGETQGSRNQAFPARWFDGLCRALPGADLSFGLPRPADWMMQSARLGSLASPLDLTVATTARTTRFRCTQGRRSSSQATHAHEVHPALHAQAPPSTPPASTATPSPRSKRRTTAPLVGWDGRHIRQIRISVKWNIFGEGVDSGSGVFRLTSGAPRRCRHALQARRASKPARAEDPSRMRPRRSFAVFSPPLSFRDEAGRRYSGQVPEGSV
jgi:hypothetical protein